MAFDTLQILLSCVVVLLMLGLGATVTPMAVKSIVLSPKAPAIGFLSQFGFMPLLAFSLAKIFKVSDAQGISMILIGSTPGGSTSNLFTYYSRGDVALSLSMTILSTITAFGMMPLLLLIYTPSFDSEDIKIPYATVVISLAIVLVPVVIGMIVLHYQPAAAKILKKVASIVGMLFIVAALVLAIVQNRDILAESGYKLYIPGALMAPAGFCAGYGLTTLCGLDGRTRRTVALETGIQNSTLTIAIIVLSFPGGDEDSDRLQEEILAFAYIYTLFLLVSGGIATLIYRRLSRKEEKEDNGEEIEKLEQEGSGEEDNVVKA